MRRAVAYVSLLICAAALWMLLRRGGSGAPEVQPWRESGAL